MEKALFYFITLIIMYTSICNLFQSNMSYRFRVIRFLGPRPAIFSNSRWPPWQRVTWPNSNTVILYTRLNAMQLYTNISISYTLWPQKKVLKKLLAERRTKNWYLILKTFERWQYRINCSICCFLCRLDHIIRIIKMKYFCVFLIIFCRHCQ